jgi:DNA-binding MarR family transcriptional regulator
MSKQASLFESATRLQRAMALLARRLRSSRPASGLSMSKLAVLGLLHRQGVTIASALAQHLRIQPQSLTRLLGDLERRGLIVRRADPEDGRQSLIELTTLGVGTLAEDAGQRRAVLADAMAALSPAERATLDQASLLIDRLAAMVAPSRRQQDAA